MNLDMRSTKKTQEGDPQDDDSYLGYSVATGEFNGDGDKMDVAVGMPRGANLTGKVTFFFKFEASSHHILIFLLNSSKT